MIETSAGPIGIGWTPRGLGRVVLSDLSADDEGVTSKRAIATARADRGAGIVEALDRAGFPVRSEPTGLGAAWGERLARHVAGEEIAYDDLHLDLDGLGDFPRRVYATAQRIPRGATWTYTQLGAAMGTSTGAAASRAVGTALGKNPVPIVVPCHRIVSAESTGGLGGYTAPGGLSTKATLLIAEGGALDDEAHSIARRHLARVDKALAPFVRKAPCTLPIRPKGALFRTLVRAIAGQQLSTKAAATIFGRLEALLLDERVAAVTTTGAVATPWPVTVAATLARTPIAALRGVGLSEAKALSVIDLAQRVASGALDLDALVRAPDRVIVERLTEVRGIGRWTVQMLLIFELGRPDVLPTADLGIRNGVQKVYAMKRAPTIDEVIARAEPWRPFRSVGSFYLWRSLDA